MVGVIAGKPQVLWPGELGELTFQLSGRRLQQLEIGFELLDAITLEVSVVRLA